MYDYDYYYGFQSTPMPPAYYNPISNFANNPNVGGGISPSFSEPQISMIGLARIVVFKTMHFT